MLNAGENLRYLDLSEDSDGSLLEDAYERLLVPAFEPSELVDLAQLRAGLAAGESQVITLQFFGAEPVGIAVTEGGGPGRIELLSYLAVAQGHRGRGLGGRLLGRLGRRWRRQKPRIVLAEIHDPRQHAATDRERPLERLTFYERNGAALLDVAWTQPALRPDGARVPGFLLAVLHPRGVVPRAMDLPELATWVEGYYRVEGPCSPSDASYRRLRAQFDRPLRVIPMADYPTIPVLE